MLRIGHHATRRDSYSKSTRGEILARNLIYIQEAQEKLSLLDQQGQIPESGSADFGLNPQEIQSFNPWERR